MTSSSLLSSKLEPSLAGRPAHGAALIGLGTAVPDRSWTQAEVLDVLTRNRPVAPRAAVLYKSIFGHPSIGARRFAVDRLETVVAESRDARQARFEREAVSLADRALRAALDASGVAAADLDALFTATCTGSLCPGLGAHLVERTRLNPGISVLDSAGMGCGAAMPLLEQAAAFVAAHPGRTAAIVCAEVCSAAFYLGDEPDLIVSNAIFADGAAAAILSAARSAGAGPPLGRVRRFDRVWMPERREGIRFRTEDGRLRNVLDAAVPSWAAEALGRLLDNLIAPEDRGAVRWALHPGGEKVLRAADLRLDLPPRALDASRTVLRSYGNMSSPSVLFVLEESLRVRPPAPGERVFLSSFGAGFSAHAALLEFA